MTLTPVAASGPAFVIFSVKVSFVPSAGVGSEAVLVKVTLAAGVGLTGTLLVGFPVGFGFVCDSVAVLVIVPALALTVTVMVAVTVAPAARDPTCQVMVPEMFEIEPVAVAELT